MVFVILMSWLFTSYSYFRKNGFTYTINKKLIIEKEKKDDKDLLLKHNPEGKIPTILLMDNIKITLIFSRISNFYEKEYEKDENLKLELK